MKLREKISIIFSVCLYPFDKECDEILKKLITKGKIVDYPYCEVKIECEGKYYFVWITNKFFGDLSFVRVCEDKDYEPSMYNEKSYVYRYKRPSKEMKIRFYTWLEEQEKK